MRRGPWLTHLLPEGSRVSSFLWHSGQKLAETQSCAETRYGAAEVQHVLKAVPVPKKANIYFHSNNVWQF